MKQMIQSEVHALDRVLELLEEQSFQYLSLNDTDFAAFVEQLYGQVSRQATRLETAQY